MRFNFTSSVPLDINLIMKLLLITCFLFISINVHANTSEFRGIWVVTWEIFRDGKDGRFYSNEEIKKNIIKILDNIKLA